MESCEQPRFLIPLAAIIYRRHTPTSLSPFGQSSVLTVKRMGSSLFPLSPLLCPRSPWCSMRGNTQARAHRCFRLALPKVRAGKGREMQARCDDVPGVVQGRGNPERVRYTSDTPLRT
jgi:hypothetical protein